MTAPLAIWGKHADSTRIPSNQEFDGLGYKDLVSQTQHQVLMTFRIPKYSKLDWILSKMLSLTTPAPF